MAAAAALVGAPLAVVGPARAALADPAADQDALVDADVAPAIAQADHQSAQLVFAHRDAGGAVTISTATVDSAAEGHAVLAVAGASGTLEAVSVDSPVTLVPDAPIEPDPGPGGPGGDVSADAVSNDFYRSLQWALDTIPFEDAWPTADGSGVTVAVLDTGVDTGHPDLVANLSPLRRHFLHDGNTAVTGTDVEDGHGHGTHVAGTIAAAAGNLTHVTGAAPGATVLPVKVLSDSGSGWMSDVAAGIVWAADNGADVINLSLGSSSSDGVLHSAVEHAYTNGVVLFAAAGNGGCTVGDAGCATNWPAAEDHVVAVGSVGAYVGVAFDPDACSTFTTRAAYVDLGAPGFGIYSTYPLNRAASGVATSSGTSMATPHAAAAAAIVLSHDPSLTPAEVIAALTGTARDAVTPGPDTCTGSGVIDPLAAIGAAPPTTAPTTAPPTTAPPPPAAPSLTGALPGRAMVRLTFRVSGTVDEIRVFRNGDLIAALPPRSRNFVDRAVPVGTHTYTVRALRDDQQSPDSRALTAAAR
ncbi:MAG: S8 family serine peptidase [Acidimicrobiales bacterium]